ncbi:MAG TPA: hydrolase, partial [Erysipelotrichaceae bacterium]|nr:hydrolase [Erysipelotrichaceae bacterium]
MIKMIATDMDGTFLDSNKQFDYEFISLFYRMQEKDIKFVIASGNQFLRLFHQFIPMSED